MKTVLYVNYYSSPVSMRFLDGVFRYAHEAKWNVQVIDDKANEDTLRQLVKFWNPVGCIYGANDGIKPKLIKAISDRPLVFMDCDLGFSHAGAGRVCCDNEAVTGMVVRQFLSMGLANFAFCGYKGRRQGQDDRHARRRAARLLPAREGAVVWTARPTPPNPRPHPCGSRQRA